MAGGENFIQLGLLVEAGSELAVAVVDCDLVPLADVDGVGVGEVGDAVFAKRDVGVGVVHYGSGLREGAGREVVREAESMAGLMGGELADALKDHGKHGVVLRGDSATGNVGTEQGLGDEVVLAAAEAAEGHVALEDLAGAGVHEGGTVAPAASVAVNPLDDIDSDVHGVGVGGEDVDFEGAGRPASGLEGLIPPACAFKESGTNGFGSAAVDVVLDGSFGLAGQPAGRVFLVQAVANYELLVE